MKARLLFVCMLFAVLVLCASCEKSVQVELPLKTTKSTLGVMSFNIRYGSANDGANSWPHRKEMVCDVIKDNKPDVVGLQEALLYQIETIMKANPQYASIGVGRDDGKSKGEFSNLLYRKDLYKATESGTFWLSDTPEIPGSITWGNACTRVCSWARLVDADGKGFYFYNVHLDHVSQSSREKSAVLIAERIKNRKHPEDMFILTGDFNAAETNPAVLYLKGKMEVEGSKNPIPMADTFRQVHVDRDVVGTFNRFTGVKDGAKIDYIFVAPDTKTIAAEILYTNVDGKYPSDHYPVTAEIQR